MLSVELLCLLYKKTVLVIVAVIFVVVGVAMYRFLVRDIVLHRKDTFPMPKQRYELRKQFGCQFMGIASITSSLLVQSMTARQVIGQLRARCKKTLLVVCQKLGSEKETGRFCLYSMANSALPVYYKGGHNTHKSWR